MRRTPMPPATSAERERRLIVLGATAFVCALALALAPLAGAVPLASLSRPSAIAAPSARGLPGGPLGDVPAALRRRLLAPLHAARSATIGSSLASGEGNIEGTVTSSASSEPIGGIDVCAFPVEETAFESEGPSFECGRTDGSGEYAMQLPAGEYDVEFFAPSDGEPNYQPQYYKGVTNPSLATAVHVTSGGDAKEIDAALLPGAAISGTVTSAATGVPLSDVIVCAEDELDEVGNCAASGASGAFKIIGLASGSYEVEFLADPEAETTYVDQSYPSTVAVTAPETRSGIDAALRLTPPIARSEPTIAGSAVVGQTLTVTHASWSNQPTSFLDNWLSCATIESKICLVDGSGASYVLQPYDVGTVIRVKEWAIGSAGKSEPVGSAATSVVVAAPAASASAPAASAPAPAAPAPATGSLASQSALASVAQLRSLLERVLVPTGSGAKIGQLLAHKGYALSFAALGPGKLTISWYEVPRGAHVSAAKPVLVASGSVSTQAGARAKLTIRLTAKGRALLAHAHRVKLTAKAALTGSGHAPLSSTRTFTLER